MDFNTQRKIVKKLKEAGKNPLLFLPCLIARCAVVLFMSACRAVDMALSDSEGNFLGIKKTRKVKKAPEPVPVPMPADRGFYRKRTERRSPLPFRPLWQRAMSLLLACAFVTMSAEITVGAEAVLEKYEPEAKQLITAAEIKDIRNTIYEADLYKNYSSSSKYALQIESGAFNGMPNLTTITLGYSESNYIGDKNFVNIAPDSTVFIRAETKEEYEKAAKTITSTEVAKVWDYKGRTYNEIPDDVTGLKAYSGVGKVILKWINPASEPDGYAVYSYENGVYKHLAPKMEIATSDAVKNSPTRIECTAEINNTSGTAVTYALRAYNKNISNDYDGDGRPDVTVPLYSKRFTMTESVKPLTAGSPDISTTMSNRTVTVNISMPTTASEPSYIVLFCKDEKDTDYSSRIKILPSLMTNGAYSFVDTVPFMGEGERSYIAVAYYDVFNKNGYLSDSQFQLPEKDEFSAEYTTKRSQSKAITDAVLNPPRDLKVTLSTDKKVWLLEWQAPENSDSIDVIYSVYANGRPIIPELNEYRDRTARISVDDSNITPGEDVEFTVIASAEGMTSADPAKYLVEVSKECVQFEKLKGGNSCAEVVFKPFGNDKNTIYTVWGYGVSETSPKNASDSLGAKFASFKLADCTANSDGTYSYKLSPLNNEVEYSFWLTCDAANCNYPSVVKSITPSDAPQPPANIVGTGYESSAVITWDPVMKEDGSGKPVDGYYISVYKANASAPVIDHVVCPEPKYTANGLENEVEYYAEVSAYINVNDSEIEGPAARSNIFKPTVTVDSTPILTVSPSGKVINISWTKVNGASEYVLKRTDPDGSSREIYRGNQNSYTDSNVNNLVEYSYRVMAIKNVDGRDYPGEYSAEQRGMINFSLKPVQGLTATGGEGGITLKWEKVDGADGYYVQYSEPGADSWSDITRVTDLTFTHTGIPNGKVYEYRIIPYAYINSVEVRTDAYAMKVQGRAGVNLPAPLDFTVTAGDGQITLKWSSVKGAEGYNIYLVGYDGSTYLLDRVSKTTAIHTNLSNNTTFTYTVTAFKYVNGEMVEGDYSVYKSATVGVVLNAPTDLTAKPGKEEISLSWKKSDGAEGYVVYSYNIATLSFTPVGIVTKTSFVHTGLIPGREYTYMVAAYKNVNGNVVYSGYSLAVSAIPESSGDNNNIEPSDFRIFITGTTPYGMSNSNLISAFAGKGAFNSDIDVRFTLSPDTVTAVQKVLNFYGEGIDSFLIYPMDIALYNAGTDTKATINEGYYLTLTIPVPDELLPYSEHISVVHVSDLDQLEILPSIHVNVDGVDCMQFTANSFSPYAFVVYLPEIGEDTGAGTPVTAQGTTGSGSGGQAVFAFRNTYLPTIYSRRARNKLYRIVRR